MALVVGGSGGLGSAICVALSRDWGRIVIGYHGNRLRAQSIAAELERLDVSARLAHVDVNSEASATEAVALAEGMGELGAVVYSAGSRKQFDYVSRISAEQWQAAFQIDVMGFLNLARAALPALRRSNGSLTATTTYQAGRIEPKGERE